MQDRNEDAPQPDHPSAHPAAAPRPIVVETSGPGVGRPGHRVGALAWWPLGEPAGEDERPVLLLLHPNGFCAGVFDPIVAGLSHRYRCLGIDVLGHGATDAPTDVSDLELAHGATEVVAVLDALGIDRVACVGHSLGGIVATLVDRMRPGLVERLVLCEPVIFPAGYERPPQEGPTIAELTHRRRAVWPDREEMRARFASRPPLDALAAASLDAYLRWGVVDRDDGEVELACPPLVEATIFEITPTARGAVPAWEHLAALTARTVVVSGDRTTLPPVFELQAARIGCEHVVTSGGHLFLHEDPAASATLLSQLLDQLGATRP